MGTVLLNVVGIVVPGRCLYPPSCLYVLLWTPHILLQ